MSNFSKILTIEELTEMKPYIKYLYTNMQVDEEEVFNTFSDIVPKGYIFRTPFMTAIANGYRVAHPASDLPNCLIN